MPHNLCARFRAIRRTLYQRFSGNTSERPPKVSEIKTQWQEYVEDNANEVFPSGHKQHIKRYTNEEIDKLIVELKRAITERKNQSEKAALFKVLGQAYYDLCVFQTARIYFQKYYEVAKKLGSLILLQRAYCHLGCADERLGCYFDAKQNYEHGLETSRRLNDLQSQAKLFDNMANIYETMGDYNRAISYQHKRLKIAQLLKDGDLEYKTRTRLGYVYSVQGDLKTSINHYQRVLTLLSRKLGNVIIIHHSRCLVNFLVVIQLTFALSNSEFYSIIAKHMKNS